jgi:hypothetical protein
MLEVVKERLEDAVRASSCEAVRKVPPDVLDLVLNGLESIVPVGMGPAANLDVIYQGRYDTIEEFRQNNFGWRGFFQALGDARGSVGLFVARGGGWRIIFLLDESSESVIASLVRPPSSDDWPEGASAT